MAAFARKDRFASAFVIATSLAVFPTCASAAPAIPQQAAATEDWPLTIPTPPGATMTTEVDARDADVLGLVRQLLTAVKDIPSPPPAKKSSSQGIRIQIGGPKPPTKPGQARPAHVDTPPQDSDSDANKNKDKDANNGPITAEQLTDLVHDIRHLHFVQLRNTDASSADNLVSFYQNAFTAEGGRRVVWTDDGKHDRVLMMAFDTPRRGFALVIQPRDSKGTITVVRTDGYPDMKALAPLVAKFLPGTSLPNQQ